MTCPHKNIKLILRPDTPHYAERRCKDCNKFMGWESSPNPEGIRKQTTQHTIQKIMTHKKYTNPPFCFFCGRTKKQLGLNETLTIDHIIPIRDNGENDITNLQILCSACHKLRHWTELYTNIHFKKEETK